MGDREVDRRVGPGTTGFSLLNALVLNREGGVHSVGRGQVFTSILIVCNMQQYYQ